MSPCGKCMVELINLRNHKKYRGEFIVVTNAPSSTYIRGNVGAANGCDRSNN